MQQAHYIIRDNGDGSQSVLWYKGCDFSVEELIKSAENDEYDSFQSGDGVQLNTIYFPKELDLNSIKGITWQCTFPGQNSI